MTTRGALATAVIQGVIVAVALAVAQTARWRERHRKHSGPRLELPGQREPRAVIDLTSAEDSVTAR
jgi:hypothetical protein